MVLHNSAEFRGIFLLKIERFRGIPRNLSPKNFEETNLKKLKDSAEFRGIFLRKLKDSAEFRGIFLLKILKKQI